MLPLFFLVSGFCMSPGKYSLGEYVWKKVKSLLFPYFALGVICSLVAIPYSGISTIVEQIATNLFSWQTLWFLPVLFVADLASYFLLSVCPKYTWIILWSVFFLIGACIMSFCKIVLPLNLSVVPIAIFYLFVGYMVKLFLKSDKSQYVSQLTYATGIIGITWFLLTRGRLNLNSNDILPIQKVFIGALLSTFILLTMRGFLSQNTGNGQQTERRNLCTRIGSYIGKNTMVILAFHMSIFSICQHYLRPHFDSQWTYKGLEFILIWTLCLLLIPLFNQFFPRLVGKNR